MPAFACCLALLATTASLAGDDPYADSVLDYDAGLNPASGYETPDVARGAPERYTGEGIFPGVVSPFNPPYGTDEIVSVGADGLLVVQFDTPVTDDPRNPFGIDLLVFGNSFFLDESYPSGVVAGLFPGTGGIIEVSADCENWVEVEGVEADGLWPTLGWLDAGPYDLEPGTLPTDFTRPVDPALTLTDFEGLNIEGILDLYDSSGGGAGVDLASVALASITCVRITNPGDPKTTVHIEIDAFADVAPADNPADIDGDGVVGINDFLIVLGTWGPCPDPCPPFCPADVDEDCTVGIGDFLAVLGAWGT